MPSTLEACKKYFKSTDLYKIFDLTKDSLQKDIKKAYYKLSLQVHPDRVPEEEKEIATEKFKVLTKLYQVLIDSNKKALYDEKGIIDEEDEEQLSTWLSFWSKMFIPITKKDIDDFKSEYLNSELERNDIKKSYLNGKGCINYMTDCIPFMDVENEPRIKNIVEEMISSKEVPAFKTFTNEPVSKRNRRHKKYANEAKEAEAENLNSDGSLEQQILERQSDRRNTFTSILDKLAAKYGNGELDSSDDDGSGDDDSESSTQLAIRSARKRKQTKKSKATNKKVKIESKTKEKTKPNPARTSKRLRK